METPRYFYYPDLSIWLSIDPLSDKYPNLTPYAYCANNPVILGDPDGREIETNLNDI
ncbi:MAG TPA: RHS repeat-associated core domain-containing protein, partial [Bacteroidales bacterium]|nr:RHS repeat-associated core domain-containing protein [Bacteroidales bacterium]